MSDTISVIREILDERKRQEALWGEQNHSPLEWLSILMEEVGEVAQEVNKMHWGQDGAQHIAAYRAELIQVAAVAVAAVECLERNIAPEEVPHANQ